MSREAAAIDPRVETNTSSSGPSSSGPTADEPAAPRSDPTADAVAQALEYQIFFGTKQPRERLVEDDLIEQFQAKRHVVRQALAQLEQRGVVLRVPNRGAFVRDFSAEEVEEITEIREALLRHAAWRMPLPARPELLAEIEAAQLAHDDAVAARDPKRIDAANERFHGLLFEACGNRQLSALIARYAYLSRAMRLYPMVDPVLLETLRGEHWRMIDALRAGDREALMRLVVGHIQHSKNIYLQVRGMMGAEADTAP